MDQALEDGTFFSSRGGPPEFEYTGISCCAPLRPALRGVVVNMVKVQIFEFLEKIIFPADSTQRVQCLNAPLYRIL